MRAQFRCRSTNAGGKMRQDKLLELRTAQFRWNRLSPLASSHLCHPKNQHFSRFARAGPDPVPARLTDKFALLEKPAVVSIFGPPKPGVGFEVAALTACSNSVRRRFEQS